MTYIIKFTLNDHFQNTIDKCLAVCKDVLKHFLQKLISKILIRVVNWNMFRQ